MKKILLIVLAVIFLILTDSCKKQDILQKASDPSTPTLKGGSLPIYEAETLTVTTSGQHSATVQPYATASAGYYSDLQATAAGEWVQYTINVATAGTYNVKVRIAIYTHNGICQLSVNGTNLGSVFDTYLAGADTWQVFDRGNVALNAGNNTFRFTVTGKNAASANFWLQPDYIDLTPVISSGIYEAETLAVTTSGQHSATDQPYATASAGYYSDFQSTAANEWVQYTINVATAGTYNIKVRIAVFTNNGKCQLSVNGTNLGTVIDTYLNGDTWTVFDKGNAALTAGNNTFRFTVTGKNAASANFWLQPDYINLTAAGGAIPVLNATYAATNITNTTATSGGYIVSGGTSTSVSGVCWSTAQNPTITGPHSTDGGPNNGTYASSITGLTAGITYYVRAYCTASGLTGYGSQISFITTGGNTINVKNPPYNATGNGSTNDTQAIQAAINACVSGGTVYVPNGTYMVNVLDGSCLTLKSNMTFRMESSSAILKAIPNNTTDVTYIIQISGKNNVTVTGGKLVGERYGHIGTTGEAGMGIAAIWGAYNVHVTNVISNDNWGDGFFVNYDSHDITFDGCTGDNNRRQGLSVSGGWNIIIQNSTFTNTNGTLPYSGIDIEPDAGPNHTTHHIQILNCQVNNNDGYGILICTQSAPIDYVTIDGCTETGNGNESIGISANGLAHHVSVTNNNPSSKNGQYNWHD